jgi:hypothetical protein
MDGDNGWAQDRFAGDNGFPRKRSSRLNQPRLGAGGGGWGPTAGGQGQGRPREEEGAGGLVGFPALAAQPPPLQCPVVFPSLQLSEGPSKNKSLSERLDAYAYGQP